MNVNSDSSDGNSNSNSISMSVSVTDGHTVATVDSSSQYDNNGQHQRQHQHYQRKRKRVSQSESESEHEGYHKGKHIDQIDYTRTCAVDVLLYMTTFIGDVDVRSFAHTSKSNLSAMRRYEYNGSLNIVCLLLKYSKLLDEHADDDSGRSIFHPQLAFGQCSSIVIDGDKLNLFHSWRSKRSNKSSVKLLVDYVQSREMIKLYSSALSLELYRNIAKPTLTTLEWLIKLFPLRPFKLSSGSLHDESSLLVKDLKLLHDIVPHWDDIQVLDILSEVYIKDLIQSNWRFPSSLTHLRFYSLDDDLSQVVLPAGLEKLALDYVWTSPSTDKWPHLPSTLETLILLGYDQSLENYRLSPSLTELKMGFCEMDELDASIFSLKRCQLPATLKLLKVGLPRNSPADDLDGLPSSLETLEFGEYFDQPLDQRRLPSSLRSLMFGYSFDHSIDSLVLPHSLTHLGLGYDFNQPIRGDIFPPQLKSLILGRRFKQPIREWKLPNSLTQLQFGLAFCEAICGLSIDYWPSALAELSWYQYPIRWIPLTSNAPYGTSFTSELTGTQRVNTRDEPLAYYHSFKTKVNANDNGMLQPIFDRTAERQQMRAYDRNDVIQMLANIRQAELNDLAE